MGAVRGRVTYQDSCHLAHAQGTKAQPRAILQAIPGLEFVEMTHPDHCCGSGGVYNLTQPEMSWRLLREKMRNVAETRGRHHRDRQHRLHDAVGGGPAPLRASQGAQVAHVVELLDEAYRAFDSSPAT